ncbi:MAG: hypothetical protein LBL71_02800 [Endomicrobium sp.]|jgi:esterase/lipase|nr:hypothetical protein [Endomicrobium sp.]
MFKKFVVLFVSFAVVLSMGAKTTADARRRKRDEDENEYVTQLKKACKNIITVGASIGGLLSTIISMRKGIYELITGSPDAQDYMWKMRNGILPDANTQKMVDDQRRRADMADAQLQIVLQMAASNPAYRPIVDAVRAVRQNPGDDPSVTTTGDSDATATGDGDASAAATNS